MSPQSPPRPEAGSHAAREHGGKLLIVEDSKSFGSLLNAKIQNALGVEVIWTRSLAETQATVARGERFFLSILDLHLPDAPEGEIVDFVLGQGIPGIVLTGEFSTELRDAMLAKGVLDYFIKDHISVIDGVIYFIDRIRRNMEITTLVVDDSVSFRTMICRFLRSYGFVVIEAGHGQEALQRMAEHAVSLVITDFQMPGMDGLQLTKKIREKYSRDQVAIIGLSSQGNRETPAQFIKGGANDFLTKPFRNEELFCRVSQNIELIEKHRKLESLVEERTAKLSEAHAQLKIREQYLRMILDSALDAIITTDREGRITDFNPAAEKLFGYTREQVMGQMLAETVVPPDLRERHQTAMNAWIEKHRNTRERLMRRIEMPALRANGDIIHLQMALTSVNNQGELFLTAFMHDITERLQLVKSLQDTLEVAESANRAKSEFLANMSHEIRTPMNAIIGMTELVLESKLNEDQLGNVTIIRNASHALLNLLNSILDLSKIDAGRLRLEKIPFDLLGRVENACETIAIMAQQKGLELWCWFDPTTPTSLMGDPTRVHQILLNLVNNAVKFTQEGEILVRVQSGPPVQGDGLNTIVPVEISVTDSGIGIPPERIGAIFDRFTQADGSITRRFGGSGLGLTISRHLALMMGGDIRVESVVGKGSTFVFAAQFEQGARAEPGAAQGLDERSPAPPPQPLEGKTLLLGLSSSQGEWMLKNYLESFGARVHRMELSQRGLLHPSDPQPDLVVLDERFMEELVARGMALTPFNNIPLLCLLPLQSGRVDEVVLSQFSHHAVVRKPVRRFALLRHVRQLLGLVSNEEKSQARAPVMAVKTRQALKILLVEDLEGDEALARGILERVGHGVTCAKTSRDAMERLGKESFDLVLLDLILPDEPEALPLIAKIKDKAPKIPLLVVTARAINEVHPGGVIPDVQGFLRKPYHAEELLTLLEPFARPRKPVPLGGDGMNTPVLKPVGVGEEAFEKARLHFLQHIPERIKGLNRALEIRDANVGWNTSEWIKNAANGVGAVRVKIKAMRLRGKIEMHQWDEARANMEELQVEIQSAVESLIEGKAGGVTPEMGVE